MMKKIIKCPLCESKLMEDCTSTVTNTHAVTEDTIGDGYIIKCWKCKRKIEIRKVNKSA